MKYFIIDNKLFISTVMQGYKWATVGLRVTQVIERHKMTLQVITAAFIIHFPEQFARDKNK